MTEQTQPTDAEIEAIWSAVSTSSIWPEYEVLLAFARAVLAKWGTPAGAGQSLTDSYVQMVPDKCDRIVWRNHYYHLPLTTPQPTQAQAGAVPLTVDEVEQLIAQWSYELHGDRARYLVRMTEQHHGIKGADHA